MQLDWRIHFLGWHIFRGEPWSWPPGALSGYLHAPSGTSIGYTDSIPLVAIPLEIVAGWLPLPLKNFGSSLLACFALQGFFAVLLVQLWTRSAVATLGAASLFVLMPTLLNRAPHPSLCAHWTVPEAREKKASPAFQPSAQDTDLPRTRAISSLTIRSEVSRTMTRTESPSAPAAASAMAAGIAAATALVTWD